MTKLIIASQNINKINEIKLKLEPIEVCGLDPQLFPEELKEEGQLLEENAVQKVKHVYDKTHKNCFADDSGLEVYALDNSPGVYSARYAGEEKNDKANTALLLKNLENATDRRAQFRTVIALIWNEDLHLFEGICRGTITSEPRGSQGFGYDPVFIPDGFDRTFAEMDIMEKTAISHRAKALEAMVTFIKKNA